MDGSSLAAKGGESKKRARRIGLRRRVEKKEKLSDTRLLLQG